MSTPDDDARRPPAPPVEPEDSGETDTATLGDNQWLDPTSDRHRRRRHTTLTRRRDRLRRKWRRWRRKRRKIAKTAHWYRPRNVVIGFVALVLVLILTALINVYATISGIRRAPLMPITSATPSIGTNIVLLSSDGQPAALALDPKTLVVQFIHISANYQSGDVIDLPADLVMGSGKSATTVRDLYTSGGVIGLIGAIQTDMNLTVNHVIQTSFQSYAKVTDDLGSLSIQTETGFQQLNGAQARAYVDQAIPGQTGVRFQHWSKAMMKGTLQPGVLLNPFTLWSVFDDTSNGIVVDDTFNNSGLVGLIWHLKSLSPSDMHFFVAPSGGNGVLHHQKVLLASPVEFSRLSTAIRDDNLATIGLFQ